MYTVDKIFKTVRYNFRINSRDNSTEFCRLVNALNTPSYSRTTHRFSPSELVSCALFRMTDPPRKPG